jgi:alanine racemase
VDEVLIHGKRCPRVDAGKSMRLTMVDVSAVPDAKIGDIVLLHGAEDGAQELRRPWNLAAVSISVPRIPKW